VSKEISKVYENAPLSNYSLKERSMIRLAELAFYLLIRIIGGTIRYEVEGWENFEAIAKAGNMPIYSVWHNRIFAGIYFFRHRGIVMMQSHGLDGEYTARFIQRLGYGSIRGSSTRGGVRALVEMIRCMKQGFPMGFTVDGPKGPRYQAKAGPVLLAKKTGNPMMPMVVETEKFYSVKSWDRLQIPMPFTRANVIIGEPIYVDENAADSEIENKRLELQKSLDDLVARGKEWREIIVR